MSDIGLNQILLNEFSENEFVDLSLSIGIDPDELTGIKAISLLNLVRRRGGFSQLVEAIKYMKPDIDLSDIDINEQRIKSDSSEIILEDDVGIASLLQQQMTPYSLKEEIAPYIVAIANLQEIVDEAKGHQSSKIRIFSIAQQSPITITVSGVSSAIELILNIVVPWRYKHRQQLAQLEIQEKSALVEKIKADALALRATAHKDRVTAEKLAKEAVNQQLLAEKAQIDIKKSHLELKREQVQLSLDILERAAPNLSEEQKLLYLTQIHEPLKVLIESNKTLRNVERKKVIDEGPQPHSSGARWIDSYSEEQNLGGLQGQTSGS